MRPLLILTVLCFSVPAKASCALDVQVEGLVCDFCARALEKVFGKQEAVDTIAVDLEASALKLTLKDGASMEDDAIAQLIADSGYDFVGVNREACSG